MLKHFLFKTKKSKLTHFIAAAGFAVTAHAENIAVDMKPGLWEHRFELAGNDQQAKNEQLNQAMLEMQKQLANMPPEQRKMMEELFAKQGMNISEKGISMQNGQVQLGSGGASVKQCVTQQQIKEGFVPKAQDGCTSKVTQSSKSTLKLSYQCSGENSSSGEGEITFVSPKEYQGSMTLVSTTEGQAKEFVTKQTGKWLSGDCGEVKPLAD